MVREYRSKTNVRISEAQDGSENVIGDNESDYESGFTKAKLDAAIGRSARRILEGQRNALLYKCMVEKPAHIESVQFEKGGIVFTVRWPFRSPKPNGAGDDGLRSAGKVEDFLNKFRGYILEQRAGRKLANVFHDEFDKFLLRYLKVYRFFADFPVEEESGRPLEHPRTLREITASELHDTAARRLAGAPKRHIPARLVDQVEKTGRIVVSTMVEIQKDLKIWVRNVRKGAREIDDSALMNMVRDKYRTDENEWMRFFGRCFRGLRLKEYYRGPEDNPMLSEPETFSAVDLARAIVGKWFLHTEGIEIPAGELKRLVKSNSKHPSKINPR